MKLTNSRWTIALLVALSPLSASAQSITFEAVAQPVPVMSTLALTALAVFLGAMAWVKMRRAGAGMASSFFVTLTVAALTSGLGINGGYIAKASANSVRTVTINFEEGINFPKTGGNFNGQQATFDLFCGSPTDFELDPNGRTTEMRVVEIDLDGGYETIEETTCEEGDVISKGQSCRITLDGGGCIG